VKYREIEISLIHLTSVFIVSGLLVGCGATQDESDFEYIGTLGAVFATFSMSESASSPRLFLKANEYEYELRFQTSTNFTNIESTPSGEIWKPGSIYGVNGALTGAVLLVDSITYIRPATTTQKAPSEIAPDVDEIGPGSIESVPLSKVLVAPQMTDTARQEAKTKLLMSEQREALRRICKETDDYAVRIEAEIGKWDSEVARIASSSDHDLVSGNELSRARMQADDARRIIADIRDDQARCRERLNSFE